MKDMIGFKYDLVSCGEGFDESVSMPKTLCTVKYPHVIRVFVLKFAYCCTDFNVLTVPGTSVNDI